MTTVHATDDEIQAYALNPTHGEPQIVNHIAACKDCNAKAATYQLLITAIVQQPEPVFDFDLASTVLAKLPVAKPAPVKKEMPGYMVAIIAVTALGIVLYLLRKSLLDMLAGVSQMIVYTTVVTALAIAIFQGIEIFKKYQRKIDALNFVE
jgi:hypothetical protein